MVFGYYYVTSQYKIKVIIFDLFIFNFVVVQLVNNLLSLILINKKVDKFFIILDNTLFKYNLFFGLVVSVQRITNWPPAVTTELSEFGTFFVATRNEFLGVYIILHLTNSIIFLFIISYFANIIFDTLLYDIVKEIQFNINYEIKLNII